MERKIKKVAKKKTFSVAIIGSISLLTSAFVCFPVFADGPVDINIVEMADDGSGGYKAWEDITGAMPGMTYSAIPRVRNDGSLPVSVKICVAESGMDVIGNIIELDEGTFSININDEYWTKESGEDAGGVVKTPIAVCYRYNSELEIGEITEPLFYEVSLSSELGNEHKNNTFNLHLSAEAANGEAPSPVPEGPDTGFNTVSYFDIVSPVFFSAMMIAMFAIIACVIRQVYKNN